jgi:hypothetical protein
MRCRSVLDVAGGLVFPGVGGGAVSGSAAGGSGWERAIAQVKLASRRVAALSSFFAYASPRAHACLVAPLRHRAHPSVQ